MHAIPFFESVSTPAQEQSRLLLISYHFPPSPAAGALRWEKLTHFAAGRGWGIDVITLDPSSQSAPDARRLDNLPSGVRAYGIPDTELAIVRIENTVWARYRALRSRSLADSTATGQPSIRVESFRRQEVRWVPRTPRDLMRAYHAMLDFRRQGRWARRATVLALDLIQPKVHRAVISCGPPHMAHEAGRRIANGTGIPLIMDLRDPWSFIQRLPEVVAHPVWWQLAGWYERRAVARAALVVGNTDLVRRELVRRYPQHRERFMSVMNGYDEDAMPDADPRTRFTIAYAGTIYLDRDPRLLFRAAARTIRELRLTPADFGIEFIGNVGEYDGISITEMARQEGIDEYLAVGPARPRQEAMEFLARATMLVSLPQDSDMAIPSKIFEYMRYDAWLLALAEPDSATGLLLQDTDADVVAPWDVDSITTVLRRRYLEHSRGVRPQPIARDNRFSRSSQAKLLFDAIDRCVDRPPAHMARETSAGAESALGTHV